MVINLVSIADKPLEGGFWSNFYRSALKTFEPLPVKGIL